MRYRIPLAALAGGLASCAVAHDPQVTVAVGALAGVGAAVAKDVLEAAGTFVVEWFRAKTRKLRGDTPQGAEPS